MRPVKLRPVRSTMRAVIFHGTLNGYAKYSCRCHSCVNARRQYDDSRIERIKLKPIPKPTACTCGRCPDCKLKQTPEERMRQHLAEVGNRLYSDIPSTLGEA
jgi:hypothetical protein